MALGWGGLLGALEHLPPFECFALFKYQKNLLWNYYTLSETIIGEFQVSMDIQMS